VPAPGIYEILRCRRLDWPDGPRLFLHDQWSRLAVFPRTETRRHLCRGNRLAQGWSKTAVEINVGIGHSALSIVGDRAYTKGNTNDTDTVSASRFPLAR
jgi:hypothetical protein